MDAATIRGPQLPAYEVDALAWVAQRLEMASTEPDGPVTTEILMGEDAILLRFPSGAERVVYVDSEPSVGGLSPSAIDAERLREELNASDTEAEILRSERDSFESDLHGAWDTIREARALLERIEYAEEELPEWLRDSATSFLMTSPAP